MLIAIYGLDTMKSFQLRPPQIFSEYIVSMAMIFRHSELIDPDLAGFIGY